MTICIAVGWSCADPHAGPEIEWPTALPIASGVSSSGPDLAVDPVSGDVLLIWLEEHDRGEEILFSRSGDSGSTWSAPVRVSTPGDSVYGNALTTPLLVAGEGVLGVVWADIPPVEEALWPQTDIRFARSTDGGVTWTDRAVLNSDTLTGPKQHKFHGAAWTGDSTFVVAWLDDRESHESHGTPSEPAVESRSGATGDDAVAPADAGDVDHTAHHDEEQVGVFAVRSHDLGATWEQNENVWPAPSACECCRLTLVGHPIEGPVAAWRYRFPGNIRDVVVAPLTAAGRLPERVHADEWHFEGCPHAGPGFALDESGRMHVTWYTGAEDEPGVFYARTRSEALSSGFEAPVRLSDPGVAPVTQTAVAAREDAGAIAVHEHYEGGVQRIAFTRISASGQTERTLIDGSAGGSHPDVVFLRDGSALVAWTELSTEGARVHLVRITGIDSITGFR